MSKFKLCSLLILIILLDSCSDKSDQNQESRNNHYINITSQNPKAVEFFRKAEHLKLNQEYREAREAYLSALRLDPNMVMALFELNEPNLNRSKKYRERAVKNLVNANEFERLHVGWDTLPGTDKGRLKKQELSRKVIKLYPDKVDGYLMLGLSYNPWDDNEAMEAIKPFEKAIEINPENFEANYHMLKVKYNGSKKSLALKKNKEFFDSFDSFAQSLITKFPKSLRIISSAADRYLNSYNFIDEGRLEMAKKLYDNCLEIANLKGSSSKSNFLRLSGKFYLQTGEKEKGFELFRTALSLSEDSNQKLSSFFRLFLAHIYTGDYLNAINEINAFENDLDNYGFSEEEILKSKVGLNNYKAIIYAHANQKDKALESLDVYKKKSDELVKFYGFKRDVDQQLNSFKNLGHVRWNLASPKEQLWHEIWVNILVGEFNKAELYLDRFEENYKERPEYWHAILDILKGDTEKGYEMIKKFDNGYMQYFKSQALISLGEKEKAKSVLDSVIQLSEGSIYNNLVIKRSLDLYKSL